MTQKYTTIQKLWVSKMIKSNSKDMFSTLNVRHTYDTADYVKYEFTCIEDKHGFVQ